jgi:uncharacterized membrane protein YqjE
MNWASLLGLGSWTAHWRAIAAEGALAAEDRLALARLEWAEQRRRLLWLALLLALFGALALMALMALSAAILVQFWESPQRVLVAWLLASAWLLTCAAALAALLSLARKTRQMFALTRRELAEDWRAIKEQL